MDTPGQRQFVQFVEVGCLDELQLEAHALGEGRDQVMLETCGRGVRAFLEKGRRCSCRCRRLGF